MIIVDSNVLIEYFGELQNFDKAQLILEGDEFFALNCMIISEVYNFLNNKIGLFYANLFVEWLVDESNNIVILEIEKDLMTKILKNKLSLNTTPLSLTDWSIILMCGEYGITGISSNQLLVSYSLGRTELF